MNYHVIVCIWGFLLLQLMLLPLTAISPYFIIHDALLYIWSLWEFVNSAWCIKILSPQEVREMGKPGLEILNSVPVQRLSGNNCDNYPSQQESRNLSQLFGPIILPMNVYRIGWYDRIVNLVCLSI